MSSDNSFFTQLPKDSFLSSIIDNYFYIHTSVTQLSLTKEFVLPFPRITFGYFFDHPFLVSNHDLNQSISSDMIISRISTHKITVQPQYEEIRILGAHIQPYCLAYFTDQSIHNLPWLINTRDLFKDVALKFKEDIHQCESPSEMFEVIESTFLNNIVFRDLSLITRAIQLINESKGNMLIHALSEHLEVTDRTLRNHFYNSVGCSPKEYIRLVKLKQVAYQMQNTPNSLTHIAYNNNYFDQAHFINDMKAITGMSPNELRKEMPNFRFLQF